jgi:hypothetical protein
MSRSYQLSAAPSIERGVRGRLDNFRETNNVRAGFKNTAYLSKSSSETCSLQIRKQPNSCVVEEPLVSVEVEKQLLLLG